MTSTTNPVSNLIYFGIPDQAAKLARNRRDGYTEGYERILACDLVHALAEHELHAALKILVQHKMRELVTVDCLLDETNPASYDTTDKMAALLAGEINRQGNQEHDALVELVTAEICTYSELAHLDDPSRRGIFIPHARPY